jgi:UDP-N-acetylglucosamine 2-epimerase (non-hydrolysing)
MPGPRRISLIFGTRPEAVKLCPLVLALRDQPELTPHVCVTGQHREMLDQVLQVFGIVPDVNLGLMQPNQTLASLTARAIQACDQYLAETRPDMVVVQGDTTTVFCAALAAFYHKIPVAHVEAGLRTWNSRSPFPEEINRVLTTRLAAHHFAPTEQARANLLRDGVASEAIFVTGNTVIDALQLAVHKVRRHPPAIPGLATGFLRAARDRRVVLVTAHRRENFGPGFESLCSGIAELARRFPTVDFVYPVHLNPHVREPVQRILAGKANVHLIEPLEYLPFVALMDACHLVLTDSGGVQEEAPSLGKPVLVMRDTTERPEAVAMGTVRLVGTNAGQIVRHVGELLTDRSAYDAMSRAVNPYGDGRAVPRIVGIIGDILGVEHGPGQLKRAA